ncbi:hypothetical protein EVAR_82138_1 [Eumeta japonica]|uniref:Uncharacterized protein n=1 Tax=Eumeta variegata TaxID=151549 RepID=A0A4C1U1N4_EUMVA|nr:hypothetical protein EVAR_82138_1 [Eumeta japonica]
MLERAWTFVPRAYTRATDVLSIVPATTIRISLHPATKSHEATRMYLLERQSSSADERGCPWAEVTVYFSLARSSFAPCKG